MDGGFKLVERLDAQWTDPHGTNARGTSARGAPACDLLAPPAAKSAYPPAVALPTQQGPAGIHFDFNQGARITLPKRAQGQWRVRLSDLDTGNVLFESENQGAFVTSTKRFFVRVRIDVWDIDDAGHATPVMSHAYDASGREALIQFPLGYASATPWRGSPTPPALPRCTVAT